MHPPGALPGFADGLALEQLHDEERLAVLGHVVVEDAHARGVPDLVRDVALAQERARRRSGREQSPSGES